MSGFSKDENSNIDSTDNVFVNTVELNKTKYSNSDYLHAYDVRKLQYIVGKPSYR